MEHGAIERIGNYLNDTENTGTCNSEPQCWSLNRSSTFLILLINNYTGKYSPVKILRVTGCRHELSETVVSLQAADVKAPAGQTCAGRHSR